jgi:hypothetical protein
VASVWALSRDGALNKLRCKQARNIALRSAKVLSFWSFEDCHTEFRRQTRLFRILLSPCGRGSLNPLDCSDDFRCQTNLSDKQSERSTWLFLSLPPTLSISVFGSGCPAITTREEALDQCPPFILQGHHRH